jgi:hypothetical protein
VSRALFALAFLLAGCTKVWPVNKNPYAMSTVPTVPAQFDIIGPVRAEQCNKVILIIPIVKDPSLLFDNLVAEAQKLGGTGVAGVQIRVTRQLVTPVYTRSCLEAKGLAVKSKPTPAPEPAPAPETPKKKKK